jgi:phosphate-selective porin OprO/OprP
LEEIAMRYGSAVVQYQSIVVATLLASATLAAPALAQSTERFDALWSHARLYAGSEDSFIRSVQLSGRFQVDQAYLDSGDEEYSDTNLRRMRLGVKVAFLDNFLLHAEAEYDPQDGDPVYQRLTDTYVAWSPNDALELTVGKHGVAFTLDGMTSSKELLAIDRSNLANNIWFTEEYMPGLSVAGEVEKFSYTVGVFSAGDANRGFGDSNGGEFFLGTIGYDFASRFDAKKAQLNINYVDNERR